MMVLGVQVLIGFDFGSVFDGGFAALPRAAQILKLVSLVALCSSFALLVAPDADHQIAGHGADTLAFHRYVSRFCGLGLFPFAIAIGLDFTVAGWRLAGQLTGIVIGVVAGGVALIMWYGIELIKRPREEHVDKPKDDEPTPVHDKIRQLMTEARVALPGAQAMLGFQFAAMLAPGFTHLTQPMRWLHFASLGMLALTIILLITPAAWHRIVERGEETQGFYDLASRFIITALVPLALGLCGDFYVVAQLVARSRTVASLLTALLASLFGGLWFGLTLIRRRAVERQRAKPVDPATATI